MVVGASAEHVVGGQTLTFDAEEPSRVPHSFKMLWGAGQAQPAKWVPGDVLGPRLRLRPLSLAIA